METTNFTPEKEVIELTEIEQIQKMMEEFAGKPYKEIPAEAELTFEEALQLDGEKLRQLTGQDHGPFELTEIEKIEKLIEEAREYEALNGKIPAAEEPEKTDVPTVH